MPVEWKISDGLVEYPEALGFMERRVDDIRQAGAQEMVWCLEHPPLYTSGTSAKHSDLLDRKRFPVYAAGRGGEYTYHGPGQRVSYAMLDLKRRMNNEPDIRAYVYSLEEWIIRTLKHYDVKGERRDGRIGIWVKMAGSKEAKIAALGIRVRKWVSYHGIAINLSPDLEHFSGIVPCGIKEYGVTSLADLGIEVDKSQFDGKLKEEFEKIF